MSNAINNNQRLVLVDALRGIALAGIVLIHAVEHFDFFRRPEVNLFFSTETDRMVMRMTFALIAGKAYSIFAFMFGLSFFIQLERQERKGVDFRLRFFWRLIILFAFGFIHSLLYKGDILHIYALFGFFLIPFYKIDTKKLIWLSVLLMLQIPTLYNLALAFVTSDYQLSGRYTRAFVREAASTYASGTLSDVVGFNLWKGRAMSWEWMYRNGRYLQLFALFILGLVIGRKRYFENIEKYKSAIIKLLIVSLITVGLFYIIRNTLTVFELTRPQTGLIRTLINSYANLAYTATIVFAFILTYIWLRRLFIFDLLANYGRISLSNYLIQSIFGIFFFYGFGFGMYKYLGSTWSLVYGFTFLGMQLIFSKIWLQHFHYGPCEWLWRALTYLNFKIKFYRYRFSNG